MGSCVNFYSADLSLFFVERKLLGSYLCYRTLNDSGIDGFLRSLSYLNFDLAKDRTL